MTEYSVHESEIMAWLADYDGEPYHALLCDPPYHLTSITKRFSAEHAAPAQYGKDGAFQRASRGFMGKQWDGGDIAFQPELWHGLGKLLYPGAFGMAFASTRGYHRMACAIEDAGFIIHPMLVWTFSSGFPKATRIDTQIDRTTGTEREKKLMPTKKGNVPGKETTISMQGGNGGFTDISEPVTELAKAWAGHRYGGQALAPALEPIVCFQRPYEGRPLDNITATGAGALNIAGAKIGIDGGGWSGNPSNGYSGGLNHSGIQSATAGRWAKNFILSHTPDCTDTECTPDCPIVHMDAQTGETGAGGSVGNIPVVTNSALNFKHGLDNHTPFISHGDSGGGSRFYFQADYVLDKLENSDPFIYAAKASTGEREAGLQAFEPVTAAHNLSSNACARCGKRVKSNGSGDKCECGELRETMQLSRLNIHSTVKPLSLAQYLATLLLPPDAYTPRRLLNPFGGSGSECIGAMLAGWETVDSIEMESEYAAIARARIAFWQAHKQNIIGQKKPKASINKVDARQMTLFDNE